MAPSKFVVKCGNYAVLVDLHILPLGSLENSSWFTPEHRKEMISLIRELLETRVRQFQEARHQKVQPKMRKDLITPIFLEGGNVRLAVHFIKRHINLRCVVRLNYRELRVFPERVVVTVSPPENSALPSGNLNLDVSEQACSKYFSSSGETEVSLPSSATVKRAILQKIAKHANIERPKCQEDLVSRSSQFQTGETAQGSSSPHKLLTKVSNTQPSKSQGDPVFALDQFQTDKVVKLSAEACHPVHVLFSSESLDDGKAVFSSKKSNSKDVCEPHHITAGLRRRPSSPREDVDHQKTKRLRLGDSNNHSSGITAPCNPLPEIAQINQSGLATSVRDPSIKSASSRPSISSRPATKEERKGSEARASRLRRLKKL